MQLGFVGTGTMGNPMAVLLEAGHTLTVYDGARPRPPYASTGHAGPTTPAPWRKPVRWCSRLYPALRR